MSNAINSPTATNLARGTIIELAENVYNNALATKENADRAADAVSQGVADANASAAIAESYAGGAAIESDKAERAATRAEQAATTAEQAATTAEQAVETAEDAAVRAEAAASGGGLRVLQHTEFPDGCYVSRPAQGTWNDNSFVVVSGISSYDGSPVVGVVPVHILYDHDFGQSNFTPWGANSNVIADADSIRIYNIYPSSVKFVLYGG